MLSNSESGELEVSLSKGGEVNLMWEAVRLEWGYSEVDLNSPEGESWEFGQVRWAAGEREGHEDRAERKTAATFSLLSALLLLMYGVYLGYVRKDLRVLGWE